MSENKVQLEPHQVLHFNRVQEILKNNKAHLDTSQMGSGKTYVTIKLAQERKLKLLVVAPVSTLSMWRETAAEYGVELVKALSYDSMRGTKNGIKHKYLNRSDKEFWITDEFQKLVQKGILLVFDEMHNLKNKKTDQIAAAHALARGIKGKSRIALLSATPCDKPIHTESIFKMLGVMNSSELCTYERFDFGEGEYVLTGFKEISDKCREWDPKKTRGILEPYGYKIPITGKNADDLAYKLYTQVAKQVLSSSMSRAQILADRDIKNGFYNLDQKQSNELGRAIGALKEAAGYTTGKKNTTAITTVLKTIEMIKVNTFARLIESTLTNNPQAKVVVFMYYKDSIAKLIAKMAKYKPMMMNGKTKPKDRDVIVAKFQEHNVTNRLLITQLKVGGIGISLDDRNGQYPRHVFISPTYYFIDMYQAMGRVYRASTKSNVIIRLVYGRDGKNMGVELEASILDALTRKTDAAKNMLANPDTERIPFPGEFEKEIEA